ncbi:MAG TPA: S8 family serine peptidase [Vicinamibacteria bacterium]|nr:S8 family serine peptidase [Vicinamibacteria bacterium]
MTTIRRRGARAALATTLGLLLLPLLAAAEDGERVIVRAPKPYTSLSALVGSLGGRVDYKYENVDALAVTIPRARLAELGAAVGPESITKDNLMAPPRPLERLDIPADDQEGEQPLTGAELVQLASAPEDYNFNEDLIHATELQSQGQIGAGITVAVIDTGTANAPAVAALAGTVLGGETFVPGDRSATSHLNDAHGTWVGTVIAGHATFRFTNTSGIVRAIKRNAPEAIQSPCPSTPAICAASSFIPMVGVAPAAKIYALKVFPASGGGAPESRIIAAMDRAITLRRNFNDGMTQTVVAGDGSEDSPNVYQALKIDVVNMSLGGPTLFAARDLEDQLTRKMIEAGIVLAAAAGNDGFAAMTGGSPGTGLGSLTVGAANTVKHERILRDMQHGVGTGLLWRPSSHIQTADFSSRGPTADGRVDPDLTANGFATFAQGASGGISLVSGTSFSGPTVAGAAALLIGGFPSATPFQIREALILSASPTALGDGSGPIDEGQGMLDVAAAAARLAGGVQDGRIREALASPIVALNILKAGFEPILFRNDRYTAHVADLRPGQVAQFFVPSDVRTDRLTVRLDNVTPELPASQQNALFGDDIFLNVVDAPTSLAVFRLSQFVNADSTFTVDNPQTGLVRVALQGDSTNAGKISADVTIERVRAAQGRPSAVGRIAEGEDVVYEVAIPAGTAKAVFETSWLATWARYPTSDLDMVLINPSGVVDVTGAASNSPERVEISKPAAGNWTVVIQGLSVHPPGSDGDEDREAADAENENRHQRGQGDDDHDQAAKERYALRVTVDGNRLQID